MIKIIEDISIDMMMLIDKNCKWNTRTIENLRNKLGIVNKCINTIKSESKEHDPKIIIALRAAH